MIYKNSFASNNLLSTQCYVLDYNTSVDSNLKKNIDNTHPNYYDLFLQCYNESNKY